MHGDAMMHYSFKASADRTGLGNGRCICVEFFMNGSDIFSSSILALIRRMLGPFQGGDLFSLVAASTSDSASYF